MSLTNLDSLLSPKAVAVIGATNEPGNIGYLVMKNLMGGGFPGPVMPVSFEAEAIAGVLTYSSVADLPKTPDLAIVCKPLQKAPAIVDALRKRGTRSVVLMGPGYARLDDKSRARLKAELLEAAQPPSLRILGPKCMGLIVPSLNLNASLAHTASLPGKTAFLSQSDSLFTTVLDWAKSHGIGFSHMISLGAQIDVSFADIMDYLGSDPLVRSILLYVESIHDARGFVSAARAASRNKPVLALRPGQGLQNALAELAAMEGASGAIGAGSLPHGLNATSDEVYDVAFRRAGMLRVESIDGLFDAAQTLAGAKPVRGDRLAILVNGSSAGIMAADALLAHGGRLARFTDETTQALDKLLHGGLVANPLGLPFGAKPMDWVEILQTVLTDPGVDAALMLHVPFAGLSGVETAQAVALAAKKAKRMVLTSWMGSELAHKARAVFADAGVPTYETPEQAIRAFLYMVQFQKNQEMLIQTPDSLPTDFFPDTTAAREVCARALAEGRSDLTPAEAKDVLTAYGIPVVETQSATSARQAVIAADELGYPVALKLKSPQISQPQEVGGVYLDLEGPDKVWEAAASILSRVSRQRPDAYVEGFVVQKMGRRTGAHELFVSAHLDPVFGPVIAFGHGGVAREMIRDRAVTLPPLNMSLAHELISRTRIYNLLHGSPQHPAADIDDICLTIIQISQLIIDVPQICALDINPLYADDGGVLSLGAKIRVAPETRPGAERLAIRPYPRELEECMVLKNGRKVTLRPIRPEDEPAHREFISKLSDEDLRLRFFGVVRRDFDHKDMARFTQIDYDREMAFIATAISEGGLPETLGVVRTATKPDNTEAEFAIVVRSDQKGTGLGSLLFQKMISYTKGRGTHHIKGQTMVENKAMQGLSKKFGFEISVNPDEELVDMVLDLTAKPE
ncbi:MAG: bifunctional acetate--CoA ligase family protein/GNAT family N-acetyltransferase [Humidesulfovibrio sp.]|uniref:bifunctional acetate--CoA ligase family protein/GNAT family N-acetyltransferase n=1 Tax=Humidesulfovibrio sp. TaxID=2910988 RepID=UPI0027F169C2|nr:bifunctional acetate--CoA ligase family protein/GNAT family N-acetyltransferase [Humidesulfovibrio sp.]MDQ7835896.1 bifunctional acetate--CoA ligase family protein/GNAT family N-acetyltransferase [Humidesulfovibrio sp.]